MDTTAASHGLAVRLAPALIAIVLGAAYASTLAPGVTWANDGADSGDLVTAAARLGVAHPTGYPTYLLLARLFQLLPLGDLAYRATLLSAVAAALAALCVYAIVRLLIGAPGWPARCGALAAALALGFSPVFWSQAVIAEVYSLNALFVGLILLFTLQTILAPQHEHPWVARGQALMVGLALGGHITVGLVAGLWFGAAAIYLPHERRVQRLLRRALWAGAGLLVYLYLPLRAAAHPPVNWGDPQDWAGFWWVVSGAPYRPLALGLPFGDLSARLINSAKLLRDQFGIMGLVLGFVGLLYGQPRARPFVWLGAIVAAAYTAFAVTYNTADSYAYLIPAFMIFAIWLGLGVDAALEWLRRWPIAGAVAALGLAAFIGWRAVALAPQVDASHDRRAIEFAERVLAAAPPNAVITADSDLDTFPLWYYHYALGRRPDLVVLVDPLLDFDWYRRNLRFVYPAFSIPNASDTGWLEALMADNPRLVFCHTNTDALPVLACDRAQGMRE